MYLFSPVRIVYRPNPDHKNKIVEFFKVIENKINLATNVKGVVSEDYGSGLIKMKRNAQEFIDYCWWGKDVSYSDFELVFSAEQVDEDGNVWTSAAIVGTTKLV
jgi:hypothetical protein